MKEKRKYPTIKLLIALQVDINRWLPGAATYAMEEYGCNNEATRMLGECYDRYFDSVVHMEKLVKMLDKGEPVEGESVELLMELSKNSIKLQTALNEIIEAYGQEGIGWRQR